MSRVSVDFTCNDGRNGHFTGAFSLIDISDDDGTLLAMYSPDINRGPSIAFEGSTVTVAGRPWPASPVKHGVGNWCWSGVQMARDIAADLARWLVSEHGFRPEEWVDDPDFGPIAEGCT